MKAAIAIIAGALTALPLCMYAAKSWEKKAKLMKPASIPEAPAPPVSAPPAAVQPVTVVIGHPLLPSQARPQLKPRPNTMQFVRATVTGYTGYDKRCDGKWWRFNRTSTGKNAKKTRGIAVDPTAIPYGTRIIIPNVGTFSADDTGGKMREDWREHGVIHIDVRFPTYREAKNWGIKQKEIGLYYR